jgi:hypothetical protein
MIDYFKKIYREIKLFFIIIENNKIKKPSVILKKKFFLMLNFLFLLKKFSFNKILKSFKNLKRKENFCFLKKFFFLFYKKIIFQKTFFSKKICHLSEQKKKILFENQKDSLGGGNNKLKNVLKKTFVEIKKIKKNYLNILFSSHTLEKNDILNKRLNKNIIKLSEIFSMKVNLYRKKTLFLKFVKKFFIFLIILLHYWATKAFFKINI